MRNANKTKREEIMNDAALTEAQKQVKIKELKKAAANEFKMILNEEQKAKLKVIGNEKEEII